MALPSGKEGGMKSTWFFLISGAVLAFVGCFSEPIGSKMAPTSGGMVVIGLALIFLAIARNDRVWPFRPSSPVLRPAYSGLFPQMAAFTRDPVRRHNVETGRGR